jgi:hypothetical protein
MALAERIAFYMTLLASIQVGKSSHGFGPLVCRDPQFLMRGEHTKKRGKKAIKMAGEG